jgi:hypothetical protein
MVVLVAAFDVSVPTSQFTLKRLGRIGQGGDRVGVGLARVGWNMDADQDRLRTDHHQQRDILLYRPVYFRVGDLILDGRFAGNCEQWPRTVTSS